MRNLFDILACPICRVGLSRRSDFLACPACSQSYPIVNGVPVIFPNGAVPDIQHEAELAVRSYYNPWVHRTILQSLCDDQVVVEIGAGNMAIDDPCIIRMDVTLSPCVDLVADAHALPFLPGSVDYIFSLAVFEHLRNPFLAAHSIYDALKDGGYIYHECNFVFAYHGYPDHYFDATMQGMEQLFSQFVPLRKGVATHQMPSFALEMVLGSYLKHSHASEYPHGQTLVALLHQVLDLGLMQYDIYFSEREALNVAAGTYLCGLKRPFPQASLIPAVIRKIWAGDQELQSRYPEPEDLSKPDNIMAWAFRAGREQYPAIERYLSGVTPFSKRGETASRSREPIRSLAFEETRFGAIGFDKENSMAENASIALERALAKKRAAEPDNASTEGTTVGAGHNSGSGPRVYGNGLPEPVAAECQPPNANPGGVDEGVWRKSRRVWREEGINGLAARAVEHLRRRLTHLL